MGEEVNTEFNIDAKSMLTKLLTGKKVLYVATTYLDYIRVKQELKLLNQLADSVKVIVSQKKSYFTRLLYVYFKLLWCRKKDYDVVFLGFAPQLILPLWFWKFKTKPVIIDFFISFYDTLVFDRQKFKASSMLAKLLLKVDKFTLKNADRIVVDTKQHALYFHQKLAAEKPKLNVLYLEADNDFYYPRNIPRPEVLQDKYVVLYFATVLPLQGVDVVIEAISKLENPNIHCLFIGPIDRSQRLILLKRPHLTYYSWLSQDKLADLIAQADLCVAGHFNDNIEKAKRTIPGKAYIFEAMNKKILLGANKANQERYPRYYNHIKLVTMGSSDALFQAILDSYVEDTNAEQ